MQSQQTDDHESPIQKPPQPMSMTVHHQTFTDDSFEYQQNIFVNGNDSKLENGINQHKAVSPVKIAEEFKSQKAQTSSGKKRLNKSAMDHQNQSKMMEQKEKHICNDHYGPRPSKYEVDNSFYNSHTNENTGDDQQSSSDYNSSSNKKRRSRTQRQKDKNDPNSSSVSQSPEKSYQPLVIGNCAVDELKGCNFEEFAKSILSQGIPNVKAKSSNEQLQGLIQKLCEYPTEKNEIHGDDNMTQGQNNNQKCGGISTNVSVNSNSAQAVIYEVQSSPNFITSNNEMMNGEPLNNDDGNEVFEVAQNLGQQFTTGQTTANPGLNEDINMQLYGQISMFDQLTDYNDIDNDEEQLMQNRLRHLHHRENGGKGEDEYSDNGEDESGNLYHYRQKIQAINDELQNFITMMTDGGQGESDDESETNTTYEMIVVQQLNQNSAEHVKEGDCKHSTSQFDFNPQQRKRLQARLKRILKFVNTLDSELNTKQQLLDQREHIIAKLT